MRFGDHLLTVLLAPAAVAVTLTCTPVRAEPEADCTGYGDLAANPALEIGHVAERVPKAFFVANGSDQAGCPAEGAACRAKAFVVAGDVVIMSLRRGAFVCADYIGPKGRDRAGWLPVSSLTPQLSPPVNPADWTGTWSRDEASVTVKPGAAGKLAIHGDATFGANDPGRVKRGAVNVGEIDGIVAPNGASLDFAMGDGKTVPVGEGGEFDCKVWMRRLGPYLLVDDNRNCGGANVGFGGAYTRAAR